MAVTINQAKLYSPAVKGNFFERYENIKDSGFSRLIAFDATSNQASEEYGWLGAVPQMREAIGGRLAKGLRENKIDIVNKVWEQTLDMKREDVERDKTGQVMIRAQELGERAGAHTDELISEAIVAGEADGAYGLAYDGQFFFDTDHSEGSSGTQDNDLGYSAVSATAPTADEMYGAIVTSIAAILGFKDDQGKPINGSARRFMVMVPPSFLPATLVACTSTIVNNTINPIANGNAYFSVQPVVNQYLAGSWTTKFAVFRMDGVTKPFINQTEVPMEWAENDLKWFSEFKLEYGTYARYNIGFGMWQHACLTTFS